MSTLKERLAAKARRTITVPVQVSDPGPARERYKNASDKVTLLQLGQADEGTESLAVALEAAEGEREAARRALEEFYVDVVFQSAEPADTERLVNAHTDSDGDLDPVLLTPALAALCAVDEDLRDEQWWTEQFAGGSWSLGERTSLYTDLLGLNIGTPEGGAPKG